MSIKVWKILCFFLYKNAVEVYKQPHAADLIWEELMIPSYESRRGETKPYFLSMHNWILQDGSHSSYTLHRDTRNWGLTLRAVLSRFWLPWPKSCSLQKKVDKSGCLAQLKKKKKKLTLQLLPPVPLSPYSHLSSHLRAYAWEIWQRMATLGRLNFLLCVWTGSIDPEKGPPDTPC